MEDSALILKKDHECHGNIDYSTALAMLNESQLVNSLLDDSKFKLETFVGLRALEWRLLELSEIPYIHLLEKVQNNLNLFVNKVLINEGFTLTGDTEGIFACHNALITKILLRLNYEDKEKIDVGINWILKYQSFNREDKCTWKGKNLYTKWGGCMKSIPCYYGVIKSLETLTEYKSKYGSNKEIDEKLKKGLEYILQHHIFKRLSSNKPIEPSILENFYPWTYKSNIIEILKLLKENNLLQHENCQEAIKILEGKRRKDGYWHADVSFMKSSWIDFDELKKPGYWISYEIEKILA